jgi:hypothetical protein
MFRNMGCHLIQYSTKRWGFVGTLPIALATLVPADTSAAMGGRAFRDDSGALVMPKFPTFETNVDALNFAASRSVKVIVD